DEVMFFKLGKLDDNNANGNPRRGWNSSIEDGNGLIKSIPHRSWMRKKETPTLPLLEEEERITMTMPMLM
ncbi:hypothetical protein PIB30_081792, partial [Stylosanthes scabra]|nr:hypothetical protein [Stylosanthes scabra]